jgi:hypothetical protein
VNGYTVDWVPDAQDELADLWIVGPDRAAITRAQNEIDRRLASNPRGAGATEVAEGLWRMTVAPLTVYYAVDDAQRLVEVSKVVRIP